MGKRGFILSLLCHLLFIRLLVFTFPTHPVAHKPLLVFLGAILEGQEFTIRPTPRYVSHIKATGQEKDISAKFRQGKFDAAHGPDIMKPSFSKNVPKGIKGIIKSTFEETPKTKDKEKNWAEGMGIDLTVPQRRPLRLHQ